MRADGCAAEEAAEATRFTSASGPSPHSPRCIAREALREELRTSFLAMERRRQQRQASGKQVARGMWAMAAEVAMFLGFSLYGLATIRRSLLGPMQDNLRYLAIPIVLTVGIMGMTIQQSVATRENLPLLWGKAWAYLLVVWALWLYEPNTSTCPGNLPDRSFFIFGTTPQEHAVFAVFLSLEAVTMLAWLVIAKIYPMLAMRCQTRAALHWFWRVRRATSRPGYSYVPNGACCSLRRCHFHYSGSEDAEGKPHGHGVWQDDSHHGEVFDGEWVRGEPRAPFVSRIFGNGSISYGRRIGYGTARAEGLSDLFCMPTRAQDGKLRLGSLGVECSAAGGFLAHLPQLVEGQHSEFESSAALVADLRADAATVFRRSYSGTRGEEYRIATEASSEADAAAYCSISTEFVRTFQESGESTALIFVHGYNCPLDWACMRLGQLMTLGRFSSKVLPFVFSWPTGQLMTFLRVRHMLPELAGDLARFVSELRAGGISEVHIMAHSMGCELVTAALPDLEEAAPSNGASPTEARSACSIASISFCNPSCPSDAFFSEDGHLCRMMRICGRLTIYSDREVVMARQDTALRFAEVLGRGKTVGRHTEPVAYGSELARRIDVVDCTSMDANVNGIRHSYFDLNTHVVQDVQELVCTGLPASRRSRLVRTAMDSNSNVFAFLAPPVFVNW